MDEVIFKALRDAYESGNLIVFVGAGVSAAVGLPTWKPLAEALRERAGQRGASAAALQEIDWYLAKDRLIEALSATKKALGETEFNREVASRLDDKGLAPPPAAEAIAALAPLVTRPGPKLRAVLTTNLDGLMEKAFKGEWDVFDEPPGDLASQRQYIFKLHGTRRKSGTWVFSRDQYDRILFGAPAVQEAFRALYWSCPILFVGCGMADDNLDQTLGLVRALSGGQPPAHYALLAGDVPPFRRDLLERSGLRLLVYENAKGDHAELVEALRRLGGAPAPAPVALPGPAVSHFTATAPVAPLPRVAPPPAPAVAAGPVRIFVCYAPEDEGIFRSLEKHLVMLRRQGLIELWHEGQIGLGEDAEEAAAGYLDAADLILMLISSDFLASEQADAMVTRAMNRRAGGQAHVAAILVRPCEWDATRFAKLVPLPYARNPVPVESWPNQDEALAAIAKDLRIFVKGFRPGAAKPGLAR